MAEDDKPAPPPHLARQIAAALYNRRRPGDLTHLLSMTSMPIDDARDMRRRYGVEAVMAARGLLANPALFAGAPATPPAAVRAFARDAVDGGLPFAVGHRALAYMLEARLSRPARLHFNALPSYASALDFLDDAGIAVRRREAHPCWPLGP